MGFWAEAQRSMGAQLWSCHIGLGGLGLFSTTTTTTIMIADSSTGKRRGK